MSLSVVGAESSPPSRAGAVAATSVLLVVVLAAALSVDVVRIGFGLKGDEATYVAMALSAAFDHDLTYERKDLERFTGLYQSGPEGLFVKRGRSWRIRTQRASPFVRIARPADPRTDRLYFGKAFVYPVVAAPFVRLAGLNGFLLLHALLLSGVVLCGYLFLAARARPVVALTYTLAFVGATVVPVYLVFLTSDIFNLATVFFAYFLWLYKEVAPRGPGRFLRTIASDCAAAALLGVATFSKPINLLLIAPLVLWFWWRRRWWAGIAVGVVFVLATAALFGVNAISSGEFNYQGGDRKTFYAHYPFEAPGVVWDGLGTTAATDDADADNVLQPAEFANRLALNLKYFVVGRHAGFVPYFFPGAVAIVAWLLSRERHSPWRWFVCAAFAASVVGILVLAPYTWNGGGGPPGNRYLLSLYPVVFFLMPPVGTLAVPMLAWIVGTLFTAHMVVNPFVAAKYTYLMFERGAARRLPVELTMANDLPMALSSSPIRARIPYRNDPLMLLYFLDQNASPPEPAGMWVTGGRRADVIVRTEDPMDHLAVSAESPIPTVLTVSVGAETVS
ncbi:MAG: hypothetical protein ABUS56_14015, partial [Acidobacteriota bacterium]